MSGALFSSYSEDFQLEVNLRSELNQPAGRGRCDSSEVDRIRAGVHTTGCSAELGVVKQVKRLDSDLEGRTLGDLRVLLQREIKVVDARAVYGVTTGIAVSPECDPWATPSN